MVSAEMVRWMRKSKAFVLPCSTRFSSVLRRAPGFSGRVHECVGNGSIDDDYIVCLFVVRLTSHVNPDIRLSQG